MITVLTSTKPGPTATVQTVSRLPQRRVRSWTGRSALSSTTETVIPRFVTAGTRKTRVSEMRDEQACRRLPDEGAAGTMTVIARSRVGEMQPPVLPSG
jgi:hypothetical protein